MGGIYLEHGCADDSLALPTAVTNPSRYCSTRWEDMILFAHRKRRPRLLLYAKVLVFLVIPDPVDLTRWHTAPLLSFLDRVHGPASDLAVGTSLSAVHK